MLPLGLFFSSYSRSAARARAARTPCNFGTEERPGAAADNENNKRDERAEGEKCAHVHILGIYVYIFMRIGVKSYRERMNGKMDRSRLGCDRISFPLVIFFVET